MSPQRRIALVSVGAAIVLIAIKLVTGLATGSLGLLSEAAHSGTDLVAALLTLFAVGVAVRPADRGHPYGHGKAEHLAALAEAAILGLVSLLIADAAVRRLVDGTGDVDATWWAFLVIGVVIVIDASRAAVSHRAARRFASPAFAASALHFGSDLAGSTAVLVGLSRRGGLPRGDAIAALFVAVLVLTPPGGSSAGTWTSSWTGAGARGRGRPRRSRGSGRGSAPPSADAPRGGASFRRRRHRRSAGVAVGQGHAAADAVEEAVERAVPGGDVVVHVEPAEAGETRRAGARGRAPRAGGARGPQRRRPRSDGRTEVSLHLKLPGSLTLAEAHEVAEGVEQEIRCSLREVDAVQTHIEPLAEPAAVSRSPTACSRASRAVREIVRETTGVDPRELRFLSTERGLVAFLTLAMAPERALAEAHASASEVEERIRRDHPEIVDVIVQPSRRQRCARSWGSPRLRAGYLAVGDGRTARGFVYGTIIVLAVLVAGQKAYPGEPGTSPRFPWHHRGPSSGSRMGLCTASPRALPKTSIFHSPTCGASAGVEELSIRWRQRLPPCRRPLA